MFKTIDYPLEFTVLPPTVQVKKRKFGADIIKSDGINLCHVRLGYSSDPSCHNAWPSVLYTLFFNGSSFDCNGPYFNSLLPKAITDSWIPVITTLPEFQIAKEDTII